MKGSTIAGVVVAMVLVLLALAGGFRALNRRNADWKKPVGSDATAAGAGAVEAHPSLLYGRILTIDGVTYEGRLRWGGTQEAFWGNYYNGVKKENRWAPLVAPERLPKQSVPIEVFGLEFGRKEEPADLSRPYMVRFGDITRIESRGRDVRVILKSGAKVDLDRFSAGDIDDGVRVWDSVQGMVNLDSLRIRAIEFLPAPLPAAAPGRLHGTVHTRQGDFNGFVQWDWEQSIGSDEIHGDSTEGEVRLSFDTIRSIARRSPKSAVVTLYDGREVVLSGTRDSGDGSRGVYVDDPRYGRVLASWEAFERVDFSAGGSGPAYNDFPPGGPLTGSITTRDGRRLAGRLVFDLDESEVTETLDAPIQGVTYTIPFGLVASIAIPGNTAGSARRAKVTLHSGEALLLECTGDLGDGNAGMLVFVQGQQSPEYVRWGDVGEIHLNRPSAMYPALGER